MRSINILQNGEMFIYDYGTPDEKQEEPNNGVDEYD